MENLKSVFAITLLLLLPITLDCANTYNVGDRVPLFINKIGPLHNPSETYEYYKLPFCRPDPVIAKKESLGEVLGGDRLANALYDLRFAVNKTEAVVCQQKLTKADIAKFRDAITNDFYYQMYYDDLPLWAYIGKVEDESWKGDDDKGKKCFLFTHVHFDAIYNGNQVIEIHAFSEPSHVVDVTEDVDVKVEFTYSISWNRTSMPYKNRMERYSRASLLRILHQSHWFSFANSIVIVILLMGLLSLLFMRHLKNDLRKWSIGDEDEEKEVGWKYIHVDVSRCPTNVPLLSAVLGCGTQLLTMISILFILAFLRVFQPYSRGSQSSIMLISYILTSAIAGYRSASFCCQHAETQWEKGLVLAGILFLGPFLLSSFILNILAASFGVTAALPLGTILVIVLVYILVSVPLLVLGGVLGHRYKSDPQSPVTKKFPREIPSLSWYRKTPAQMFLAGLLPFSAVALELHHFYATIWGYKVYNSPTMLLFTFVVLVLITVMLSVGMTYFQLTVEDHEWWWRSILRGGSTAIFMFCYSIYFYMQSNMRGTLQTAFFFGYNACICYAFFLMLGAVSFQTSLLFIRRIYHAIKSE